MFQTNVDVHKRELGMFPVRKEICLNLEMCLNCCECASVTTTEAYFPNCGIFDGIFLSKEICLIHVYECEHSSETSF